MSLCLMQVYWHLCPTCIPQPLSMWARTGLQHDQRTCLAFVPWFPVGNGCSQKNHSGKFDWAISILQFFDEIHLILYISMYIYQKIPHTQKCKGNEEEESEYWVLNPYKSPDCSILNLCIILKWIKLLYSPTSWEIRVMAKYDQAKYFSNHCTNSPKNNHKIQRISFPTNV